MEEPEELTRRDALHFRILNEKNTTKKLSNKNLINVRLYNCKLKIKFNKKIKINKEKANNKKIFKLKR